MTGVKLSKKLKYNFKKKKKNQNENVISRKEIW